MEEIKSNPKNIIFATLTFSEESLKKLEYDEKEPNKAPQKATYRDWETDRKSTRLNSSHRSLSRMPSSA